MNKLFLLSVGLGAVLFTGCKKDENPVVPVEEMEIPYSSLSVSSNYFETFKGDNGQTSVDISGQGTRIAMLKEMDAYMKSGLKGALDVNKLRSMFENKNGAFTDPALNEATTKTIVSKTAQSFGAVAADEERQRFYEMFAALANASTSSSQIAEAGKAGVLGGKYLVDENGFEYGQFIQKGLIGAMMLDQISNVYLGTEKQSADNNSVVEGKNYTALEHHWDEAYGYLTQNETFPKKAADGKYMESYLGGYVRQVSGDYGNPEAVYLAFLKGRAAIVNNDMTIRDEQIAYIRTSLEKAIAVVAVSYLNKARTTSDDGPKYHALSEGVGFIYALRFAHNPKINTEKSNALIEKLTGKEKGFWSLSNENLNEVRDELADAFGIDQDHIVNH